MENPLISKIVERRSENAFFYIFTILTLFTFAIFLHHHHFVSPTATSESDVGMPVDRLHLLRTYFILAALPDEMREHPNYLGPNTNIVDLRFCLAPETPSCDGICEYRRRGVHHPSPFCKSQRRSSETGSIECWETNDMRCWGWDSSVHDGIQEWDVMSEDLTGTFGVPWIHFASSTIPITQFIVFGRGQIKPFVSISDTLRTFPTSPLLMHLRTISMNTLVVLGGHSQGAAWAACLNIFLRNLGRPSWSRYVIGTGTPLADLEFHRTWDDLADAQETSTFLLSAITETTSEARLMTDIYMAQQSMEPFVKTFPQHAFACTPDINGKIKCQDPQPILFSMTNTLQNTRPAVDDTLIQALHNFGTYQLCFFKCETYFAKYGITFEPNVGEFQIQPPYTNLHPSLQQLEAPSQPSAGFGEAGPSNAGPSTPANSGQNIGVEQGESSNPSSGGTELQNPADNEVGPQGGVTIFPSTSPTKPPQAEAGPSQGAQLPPESVPERGAVESLLMLDPASSIEGHDENDTTKIAAKVRSILKVVLLMLKPTKGEHFSLFLNRVVQAVRSRLIEASSPPTNYSFWQRNWFEAEVTKAYYKKAL